MIAVDTNILVSAHRRDSACFVSADEAMRSLMAGRAPWAIPWPCIHEFLAITTHPKIFKPPSSMSQAIDQVRAWLESPTVVVLSEPGDYLEVLSQIVSADGVRGAMVHDARIAAICVAHGVAMLWTADRDFSRFPVLSTLNPLDGGR